MNEVDKIIEYIQKIYADRFVEDSLNIKNREHKILSLFENASYFDIGKIVLNTKKYFCEVKPKSDFMYHFPIDLESNGRLFRSKSIEKW